MTSAYAHRPRMCRTRCHLCPWVTYGIGAAGIRYWLAHLDTHLGPNRRKATQ